MFVRSEMIGKRERFYLVKSIRQDGKVRQIVIAYLGNQTSLEYAIAQQKQRLARATKPEAIERLAARIRKLECLVVPKVANGDCRKFRHYTED